MAASQTLTHLWQSKHGSRKEADKLEISEHVYSADEEQASDETDDDNDLIGDLVVGVIWLLVQNSSKCSW